MDPARLAQVRDYALAMGGGSGLITRGGRVVMSWGPTGDRYDLKSSTKSFGTTILGLAVQDGLVGTQNSALSHYAGFGVPPASNAGTGWLDDITLGQLATHTGGFTKPADFIDLIYQPGTAWSYSDGGANWLADVLTVKFGQDLRTVLFQRVLNDLGVTSSGLVWRDNQYRGTTIEGIPRREFGAGISASVDVMARMGYLYLRGGRWEGSQIIPQAFVDAARAPVPGVMGLPVLDTANFPNASNHYGMLWWNNGDGTLPYVPTDAYWSWGLGESFIIVIPSLDIVVARAGGGWQSGFTGKYSVLDPFLTPIAQSVMGPPVNQGPIVSAGPDQAIVSPQNSAVLNGTAGDDDLPAGPPSTSWSFVSGPGTVTFSDPSALGPTATFGAGGTYVLRLTADDGALSASDDVRIALTSATPPVAHWKLDEGAGTTALNSAGDGLSGTLVNGPAWVVGTLGQALSFDGINDFLQVNDPGSGSALDLPADFSQSAWVRFDALPSTGSARYPRILQKSIDTNYAGSYYLAVRTTGAPSVLSLRLKFGGTTYTLDGVQTLLTNRWYHVAAVKTGTAVRLYVDGVQDGPTFAVPPGAPDANNNPLYLGESPSNSDGALDGTVDDVRLYARALSESEVAQLAAPVPDTTPPSAPTSLSATAVSTTQVDLAWVTALDAESGIASYIVERNGMDAGTSNTVSFTDTGRQPSTTYTYTVRAVNGGGLTGAPSAPDTATTPAPVNQAPTVSAGADQSVTLPLNTVALIGAVSDDGLPNGTLTHAWSLVGGSGTVTFSDSTELDASAMFSTAGAYVLRLTAQDGALSASDDVQVTVNPEPPPSALFQSYLAFDGGNDYVRLNDPGTGSAIDLGASFTVGAWVRFDALPSSGSARNPRIVQKSSSTSSAGSYYLSIRTSSGPSVISLRLKFGATTYTLDGTQSLATNRWYHVAAVKEGSAVRLYLDAAQDGPTFTVPTGAPDANNDPLYVGEAPSNSDGALDGAVEDVRLYNSALSAAAIQATKDTELTGSEAGLTLYLPFNEGSGQTVTSLASGGVAGWRGSSAAVESADPTWVTGGSGSLLSRGDPAGSAIESAASRANGAAGFWIGRPSPNPANPRVTLVVHSDRQQVGYMEVYDLHGRLVKRLEARVQIGSTSLVWDGSTQTGQPAASGVYILRLRAAGRTASQRVTLLR